MPRTVTNRIRVLTLGGLGVERDGATLSALSSQRKALALLAVLAAHGQKGVSRDRIIALLWSEGDTDSARNALAQLLHRVRRELGPESIAGNGELRLNESVVSSDFGEFRAALAEGDAVRAVSLYGGDFLHSVQLRLGAEFDRWMEAEQRAIRADCIRALEQLASAAASRADAGASAEWRRRLVDLDPLSATYALRYMDALVTVGNREGAIRHAMVYAALVRTELDAEPDTAVMRRADELRAGAAAMTAALPSAVRSAEEQIAATKAKPARLSFEDSKPAASQREPSLRRSATLAVAAVFVLFALAVGQRFRSSATPVSASAVSHIPVGEVRLTRLANSSLVQTSGEVSPDGRYFYSGSGQNLRELTRLELATGRVDTIARFEGEIDNVRPSPDGKLVALAVWLDVAPSERDRYQGTSLWVVGTDGSGKRMLARPDYMADYEPRGWTTESKQIVVLAQRDTLIGGRPNFDSYFDVVTLADGSVRRVARIGTGWPWRTNASPDGRFVAYTHFDNQRGRTHLRLLDPHKGRTVDLRPQLSNEEFFDWAPDGKGFYFLRERGIGQTLWFQRFDGTRAADTAQLVKSDLPRLSSVGIARDGSMHYVVLGEFTQVSTGIIDSIAGRVPTLTAVDNRPPYGTLGGLFSPDGRRFAYLAQHAPAVVPGEASLIIQSLDGSESREVPVPLRSTAMPNWSPDSREITLVGRGTKGWESIVVNAESGRSAPARSPHNPPWLTLGRPVILPGRNFLVGLADTADLKGVERASNFVVRIDDATGRETVLGRVPRMVRMSSAPDGKSFAAFVQENGYQIINVHAIANDGISFVRAIGRVDVEMTGRDATTAAWCSDGRWIMVAVDVQRMNSPPLTRFMRFNVDGAPPTRLFDLPGRYLLQSLHSDCRRFSVLRLRTPTTELFKLEAPRGLTR